MLNQVCSWQLVLLVCWMLHATSYMLNSGLVAIKRLIAPNSSSYPAISLCHGRQRGMIPNKNPQTPPITDIIVINQQGKKGDECFLLIWFES